MGLNFYDYHSFQQKRLGPTVMNTTVPYHWIMHACTKGQIISECPYKIIVYPKITTKKFPRFLPWPLRRGQIKKIKALYYTNEGLFNIIGLIKFLV